MVKKRGLIKPIEIDLEEMNIKKKGIQEMVRKDTCFDLFSEHMDSKSYPTHLKYKLKYRSKHRIYKKIDLMVRFGLVTGYIYVRLLLEKINLAK